MKLGELIEHRRRQLGGRSYAGIVAAARAADPTYTLTKPTISGFVRHPLRAVPEPRTLEALAAGLELSVNEVALAAVESVTGTRPVEVPNLPGWSALVTILEGRSEEELTALLGVVRTVAAALDAASPASPDGAVDGAAPSGSTRRTLIGVASST